MLVGGTGLNAVTSFFLPLNGTISTSISANAATEGEEGGAGAAEQVVQYRWRRDEPIERAPDAAEGSSDRFGEALQMSASPSDNGRVAVIGASSFSGGVGRAYVYWLKVFPARKWVLQSVLAPVDPRPGHLFGSAVSVSGAHVAVGMCTGTGTKQAAGSVHIYRTPSAGSSARYTLQVRLKPAVSADGDDFGCSVALAKTDVPIPQAVPIAEEQRGEDAYKTVLFVGAWNSYASAAVTGGSEGDHKGAVHTFQMVPSDLQADTGYVWEESALLSMYERVGMAPAWSPDTDSDNHIASRFGRSLAVSADAKNCVVGHDYLEWQNYNLNPGMVVYFRDSMVEEFFLSHLLVACNSFMMLLGLLSVAFCGSLCCGTFLKKGRHKRIQFNQLDMSERHVHYAVEEEGDGAGSSDQKSLLQHEGGDSDEEVDMEAGGGVKIRKPRRIAEMEMVRVSSEKQAAGAEVGSATHSASEPTLGIDLGNLDDDSSHRGGEGGYSEEMSAAEPVSTSAFSVTLGSAELPSPSSSADALAAPIHQPAIKSALKKPAAPEENPDAPPTSRSRGGGTIIAFRARDMVFDLLLSLSTSVCAYCFFYLLDLRRCTSAFYGLLVLHLLLGVLPAVLILLDAFYPKFLRQLCLVKCLWTGLEPYHLILRNIRNYTHMFVRQQQKQHRSRGSDIGTSDLGTSSSSAHDHTQDGSIKVPHGRYASFVWRALNSTEKILIACTLLGGGGALTSMLRFLPWRQTVFSVHSGGYPTYSVLKYAEYPAVLLYVIYAIVLCVALWGAPPPADPSSLEYVEYMDKPMDDALADGGDSGLDIDSVANEAPLPSAPLSALSLSLAASDTTDWARQRAGHRPLHLDVITSGGMYVCSMCIR